MAANVTYRPSQASLARLLDVACTGRSVPADTGLVVSRHRALLLSAITAAIRTEKGEIDFDPALRGAPPKIHFKKDHPSFLKGTSSVGEGQVRRRSSVLHKPLETPTPPLLSCG